MDLQLCTLSQEKVLPERHLKSVSPMVRQWHSKGRYRELNFAGSLTALCKLKLPLLLHSPLAMPLDRAIVTNT